MEDLTSGAWPTATRLRPGAMIRATNAGASTLSERAIQSSIPKAFRQPPLRLVEPSMTDAPRRRTVLLIDDNHHHRIPLLRALRARKYDVLYAADGCREELFRTSLREIDALIACAEMRRMSGFELARSVRSARPEIAVLLMCRSFAGSELVNRRFEHGFPMIEEPFTPDQLTRRLAEVLAASQRTDCPESR